MQRCGVALRVLPDAPRPRKKPYLHGNKILAALDHRGGSHAMFLDSDMLCLAPLDVAPLVSNAIALVP